LATTAESTEIALKSVLVAYDFSDASRKPLRHAVSIARHFAAKLYVAHVVSSLGYVIAGPEASQLGYAGGVRDARELEAGLQKSGLLNGLQYEFIVCEGNVWEQVEAIIRDKHIDAVVVGTHARGGVSRLVLGSVAEQILRQANCLTLTVGPGSCEDSLIERDKLIRTFLFATDFSADSLRVLPYAVSFARQFKAKLVVLHVLPAAPIPETFHWSTTGDLVDMRKRAALASQTLFAQLVAPHVPDTIALKFVVKFGIARDQILEACHQLKPDLLIFGLKAVKHAEARSHLPWIAAHEILTRASCPILTLQDSA
jgi:nucleotide-binding universal stress UspA family protein